MHYLDKLNMQRKVFCSIVFTKETEFLNLAVRHNEELALIRHHKIFDMPHTLKVY